MSQVTETKQRKPTRVRMAEWRERMKAEGFEPITEWVPTESKALVRDICKKLREVKRTAKTK